MANPQHAMFERPVFGRLNTANHLIGDRAALDAAWERDGYWYFKDVLPKDVIGDMRAMWIDYLQRQGLIDPGVNENHFNGASFEGKSVTPESLTRIDEFNRNDAHKMLTENPQVNAAMKAILGDDPFWLPIAEYRANPPTTKPSENRFLFPHQDGFYSRGMPMKICWIPLDSIDDEVGGCAWIGGVHRGPSLHDLNNPPLFPIPTDVVPVSGWLRADFEPGDIVIFDLNTPHSGLTNLSKDRFRMSLDIRVTEASGKVPTIGPVISLTQEKVTLKDAKSGAERSFAVTADTYVRNTNGAKREGEDIPTTFAAGETILVNSDDGKTATLVRAIH